MEDLKKIVERFAIEGEVKEIAPLGNGLINDTYKVTTEGNTPDYVLQSNCCTLRCNPGR